MKNEGVREAGKCSKMVPDRGDRCLFTFLSSNRLFFNAFPFPVSCKDQLIGNWHENRRGAPKTIHLLIIRQYYWRTDAPCATNNGGPNTKIIIGAPCLVSIAYWRRGTSVCQYIGVLWPPHHYYWRTDDFKSPFGGQNKKKMRTNQFGAPRLFSSFTNRKQKYIEEKMTGTLIATV